MKSDLYKTALTKEVNNLITKDTENDQYYWLGSSYVIASSDCADFGLYLVYDSGVYGTTLFYSYGGCNDESDSFGLRPVVSLESDVSLSEVGDGTWNIN